MKTQQIVLASRPNGLPDDSNFRIEKTELPEPADGEVLLQTMYFSADPYMRGRMNDAKSFMPPFQLNQPIEGGAVAKVIDSKSDDFVNGELVLGRLPWMLHCIAKAKNLQKIDDSLAPASYYLGILGMPGLTAYFGLTEIGKPKAGETVVVSGAAGAVGLVVGQIAKIMECNVIGIAGSDEKVNMLTKEFGFNDAVNYKTTVDLRHTISAMCPQAVDIYYDNVGGEIADAVIFNLNNYARVVVCGQISTVNSAEWQSGPRIYPILLGKRASIQGFTSGDYQNRFPEGIEKLSYWLKSGKIKYKETVLQGFHQLPKALTGLFTGDNMGKMVVEI